MIKYFICIFLFFIAPYGLADKAHYCGTHHGYIQIGDTIEQVRRVCGPASSIVHEERGRPTTQPVKRWYYNNRNLHGLIVEFIDGRVFSIGSNTLNYNHHELSANHYGHYSPYFSHDAHLYHRDAHVQSYFHHGGQPSSAQCAANGFIHVGDSVRHVISQCGYPSRETIVRRRVLNGLPKVTVMKYNNGHHLPMTKLTFEEGRLIHIDKSEYGFDD